MALHTGPKLLLCAMYHRVNTSREQFQKLASLTSFLSLLELVSLLMVSVVPSIELYNLHIIATGVFLVSSALHMTLSFYLSMSDRLDDQPLVKQKNICRNNAQSSLFKMGSNHFQLRKSLHYKQVGQVLFKDWTIHICVQVLLMTHLLSIVISLYFYWRHNAYCEPGIYSGEETLNRIIFLNFLNISKYFSVFSLCEYIVILSNMAYHATSYYDFYHVNINLANLL